MEKRSTLLSKNRINKEFSLIELIVVIAIMVVLVAVLAPVFFKYIDKSRESTCISNVDNIQRECIMRRAESEGVLTTADVDAIMAKHEATKNGNVYEGLCPSDGTYTVAVDESDYSVTITCSKHGVVADEETIIKEYVGTILDNDELKEYFKNKADKSTVDSEATFEGRDSMAVKLSQYMQDTFGIDPAQSSYRIYKNSSDEYTVTWTTSNIKGVEKGTYIDAYQYNSKTGEMIKGTVTVGTKTTEGSTYPVIDGGTFKEK